MKTYKLKIREFRNLKGMTQIELAHNIGISQNFLSEIENGVYDVKVSLLCKIAIVLDVTLNDLIEYNDYHEKGAP